MRSSSSSSDAFVVTDRGEGLMSIFIAGRGSSGAQGRGGRPGSARKVAGGGRVGSRAARKSSAAGRKHGVECRPQNSVGCCRCIDITGRKTRWDVAGCIDITTVVGHVRHGREGLPRGARRRRRAPREPRARPRRLPDAGADAAADDDPHGGGLRLEDVPRRPLHARRDADLRRRVAGLGLHVPERRQLDVLRPLLQLREPQHVPQPHRQVLVRGRGRRRRPAAATIFERFCVGK